MVRKPCKCFRKGFLARTAPPSRPRWYNRRQLNTWLALTPFARAIRATDVVASKFSSTMRRFSAIEHRRRLGCAGDAAGADSTVTRAEAFILRGPHVRMTCYTLPDLDGQDRTLTFEPRFSNATGTAKEYW